MRTGEKEYRIPVKKPCANEALALRRPLCGCVRNLLYITPDGKMLLCMPFTGTPVQDAITETPLREALSGSEYMRLIDLRVGDLLAKNSRCAACEHRLYCGAGCRANAMKDSGDYLGVDETTCAFFREGREEKIRLAAALWSMPQPPLFESACPHTGP